MHKGIGFAFHQRAKYYANINAFFPSWSIGPCTLQIRGFWSSWTIIFRMSDGCLAPLSYALGAWPCLPPHGEPSESMNQSKSPRMSKAMPMGSLAQEASPLWLPKQELDKDLSSRHTIIEGGGKPRKPWLYAKNHGQVKRAESGRKHLPEGRAYWLVIR